MSTDKALQCAQEVINECRVCECGHTESEHAMLDDTTACRFDGCDCTAHTPVAFIVMRKDAANRLAEFGKATGASPWT